MKLICTQENLKKAISSVERVVGKKSTLPILENILFEAKNGLVYVSSTNLELGVVFQLSAKIEREGRVAVPAKILSVFVGNLRSDALVEISVEGFVMLLASGSHTANIQGFDPEEFPLIPAPLEEDFRCACQAQELHKALQKNLIAVNPSNIRIEFSGVYMFFGDTEIVMASTDSFRLVETRVTLEKKEDQEDLGVILPYQALSEITRLIGENVKKVKMGIRDGQIFVRFDDGVFLVSRLIQGNFPDYKQIIPKEFQVRVVLKKEELIQSMRLALAFLGNMFGEVEFSFHEKRLTLRTESEKTGKNTSILDLKDDVADLVIVFNPKYVLDALQITEEENVSLCLNGGSSPTVFQATLEKDMKSIYVLMPIKK